MSKKKTIFESVNRKPGENIAQLMSDVTFKNDDIAVEELICNGYDADAETVYIFFDKKNEVLKVFDDGTGMGKRGIEAFYRVGDSEKVSKKRTKKGRIPIGDRGIATLAIAFLSNNYTLETISSGEKRTVTEDVSEGVGDCSKNIKFPVEKVRNQKNGTKISMKGLKALKEGRDFSLEGLVKSIGNNMPIAPDFKVFVNDKEVKSRKIEKATEYFFDIKTPSAGRVSGSFFLCSSTIKDQRERGVFIRVNGRVVGDPNYFNLAHIKGAFGSKMVGFIEANGLDDCIGVDRSRFQTGSRKFREVEGVIREILGTI
ncbi:ATP-binding protein, partial [Candidatus Woesearchaeota archaeon]|nr:ATP-binding protein [Candidatus Woesearchaeota archaeon]